MRIKKQWIAASWGDAAAFFGACYFVKKRYLLLGGEGFYAAEQKREYYFYGHDVLCDGVLDEHVQRRDEYGRACRRKHPGRLARFPDCVRLRDVLDWFLVSKVAKWFSFRFIVKPTSKPLHIILSISSCMVVQMVIVMSFYGALELCFEGHIGWDALVVTWLTNIPKNFIMALPFQLLVAGPLVRKLFRKAFPEGKVLA